MNDSIVKLFWQFMLIFNMLIWVNEAAIAAVLDVGACATCGIQVDGTIACGGCGYSHKPTNDLSQFKNIQGNTFSQISVGYIRCSINKNPKII